MTSRIVITADPREKITVSLVGVEYVVTPPKVASALRMAQAAVAVANNTDADSNDPQAGVDAFEALMGWVRAAMGKKQAAAVRKRLEDDDDLLDMSHVSELMEKITEATTGNPTT